MDKKYSSEISCCFLLKGSPRGHRLPIFCRYNERSFLPPNFDEIEEKSRQVKSVLHPFKLYSGLLTNP